MSKSTCILLLIVLTLLIFVSYQYVTLSSQYNRLLDNYNGLNGLYVGSQNSYNQLEFRYNQSQYMYNQLLGNYSRTRIIYQSPATNNSIIIWTIPQNIQSRRSIRWALLDTFVNHIQIQTNQPAQFLVMSIDDYANFVNGKQYVAAYNSTGTHFSADVHLAQGCGVYVLVIVNLESSTTVVSPNVTATYAPTPFLTGVCSLP